MVNSVGDTADHGASISVQALPVLDLDWVIRAIGDDPRDYAELVEIFMAELPKMLVALQRSAAGANPDALLSVIHEACNSLGVIGALRGAAQTHALERRWRQGEPVAAEEASELVRLALMDAGEALTHWMASRPLSPAP